MSTFLANHTCLHIEDSQEPRVAPMPGGSVSLTIHSSDYSGGSQSSLALYGTPEDVRALLVRSLEAVDGLLAVAEPEVEPAEVNA